MDNLFLTLNVISFADYLQSFLNGSVEHLYPASIVLLIEDLFIFVYKIAWIIVNIINA